MSARQLSRLERAAKRFKLTPRETEALTLLAGGTKRDAVAAEMGITPRGVQFHLEKIFRKVGVQTLAAVVPKMIL